MSEGPDTKLTRSILRVQTVQTWYSAANTAEGLANELETQRLRVSGPDALRRLAELFRGVATSLQGDNKPDVSRG